VVLAAPAVTACDTEMVAAGTAPVALATAGVTVCETEIVGERAAPVLFATAGVTVAEAAATSHQATVRRGRALTALRRKTAFRGIGQPISCTVTVKA
jgi:hypothetical protein